MSTKEYGSYKKPAQDSTIGYEKNPVIKEPESRSTPKSSRYASIGKPESKEVAVTEPLSDMYKHSEDLPITEGKAGGRIKGRDKLPKFGYLQDSVFIYNQKTRDYQFAWEHRFNKRFQHWFFSNTSHSENGTVYSQAFYCAPYRWALILINVTGSDAAALKIQIYPEFSWDGVSFFPYMENWWGMDMITGAMAVSTYRQSMPVPILAPYMRMAYVVSGLDQTEWSNITITAIFNSV